MLWPGQDRRRPELDIQIVLTFAVYNLIRKYHLGDVLMTGLTG